jgi:hypothetical protein
MRATACAAALVFSGLAGRTLLEGPSLAEEGVLPQLKRLFIGRPIPSHLAHHERLSRVTGLAVLSSDPLSSVAYATEEILRVLLLAGVTALSVAGPIALVIAGILAIVVFSYRETVHEYPGGGGAYVVARENIGATAGLIAGAALLIDYVLTVSVSIAARGVPLCGTRVTASVVDGTVIGIHRQPDRRKAPRLCDGRRSGIRAGAMVASPVSQSAGAVDQGSAVVQAQYRRDKRAVSPRRLMNTEADMHNTYSMACALFVLLTVALAACNGPRLRRDDAARICEHLYRTGQLRGEREKAVTSCIDAIRDEIGVAEQFLTPTR